MKARITLGLFGFAALLASCGSSPKEEGKKEKPEKKIEYPQALASRLNYFPDLSLDLVMDTLFLDSLQKDTFKPGKSLNSEMVRFLTVKMNRDDLTQPNYYYLNDFYKIESYKNKGKYQNYLDSLDIGMTQDAHCHAIGKMEFGDSLALLIWQLNYESYQACPYFTGAHIFGSIVSKGEIKRTMQLAGYESAGDPPISSQTYQLFRISHNGIIDRSLYIQVMEEEALVEDVKHFYINRLTSQGFIKL